MQKIVRTLIGAAGLLLFIGGGLGGLGVGALQVWNKVSGAAFSDGAATAVMMFVFGVVGGIAWLLASIDSQLSKTGTRN